MTDKQIAKLIAQKCNQLGGKVYYVGGCVRDELLGIESKDIDIEVHGIQQSDLEKVLDEIGETKKVGASFGVYKISGSDIDIALPRTERKTGDKHTDFNVGINPFIGEKGAARRRDFTINGLMKNVLTGEVLDFYGGQQDLENCVIRHIDDKAFPEDPLRVLRAAQFASRFNFSISEKTIEMCKSIDISTLSGERVFEETKKALMKSEKPSIFFNTLRDMNQLDHWYSELKALIGVLQNQKFHQEGDAWNHTMLTVDIASTLKHEAKMPKNYMLACLCHDLGKPSTTTCDEAGIYHSIGHEEVGVLVVATFLERMTQESKVLDYVENMVKMHLQPIANIMNGATPKTMNKMFEKSICPNDLLLVSKADKLGSLPSKYTEEKALREALENYETLMIKSPKIQGRDLMERGLMPGKEFSKILALANELLLSGKSREDAIIEAIKGSACNKYPKNSIGNTIKKARQICEQKSGGTNMQNVDKTDSPSNR